MTTIARVLTRPSNLIVLAAVAFLLADATIVYIAARGDFAIDFTCCYQKAGRRLLEDPASLYAWSDDYTFRYSPWAALLLAPLAPLSEGGAVVAWLVVKVALLAAAAVWYARPWEGGARLLAAGLVLFFPPIWHDLALGNVSTFTVAVLLGLLRWPDRPGGALFGLLLLLAPKPHLLPIAVWLAVRRPRAAAAAAAVLAIGALLGVVVFGVDRWIEYVATFREPLGREFTANVGFSSLVEGPIGVALGIVAAAAVLVIALRSHGPLGLGRSIAAGILLGPYSFIHYLSGLLVAAEPMLRRNPRLLAPFPWLLVVFPLIPIWVLVFAALSYAGGASRGHSSSNRTEMSSR